MIRWLGDGVHVDAVTACHLLFPAAVPLAGWLACFTARLQELQARCCCQLLQVQEVLECHQQQRPDTVVLGDAVRFTLLLLNSS